ncbi:MAG TPA: hypothetical protein VFD70_27325, partial [Anaerolineae bacterium]|nr:hypothetical protein [Anaerolineae bacterium]
MAGELDPIISAARFLPPFLALGAFFLTVARVETALPLLILATALDRYRFVFAIGGLRIEHFVFAGVALAWMLKTRPTIREFHFSRADLLLIAYLALGLISSLLFAPIFSASLQFLALMVFGIVLYWLVRAIASNAREFTRGAGALVVVGVGVAAFGILAWLVYPLGVNLGVQAYRLENFVTFSPFGTLFDSNTFGMYVMAATLLQITLLLDTQFARYRLAL